jgi:hypothetical protein
MDHAKDSENRELHRGVDNCTGLPHELASEDLTVILEQVVGAERGDELLG